MVEKCNRPDVEEFVKGIFKPGAVLVSYGMRGGGKTHCAVSYCQRLVEGYYSTTPKHVEIITNVIFVKKIEGDTFVTESPKGVHTIHSMRELFPIIVEVLEKYGRKDTMIILLLDEAQNFLLGDMNNATQMASSMKKFCGIIRKFNLCLWLLSPAMRNLGPAFRNFLDADNDPGNVNCTFQKENNKAQRWIKSRGMDMDPRSIVYVQPGYNERTQMMLVPTSSWTRNPDDLDVGEYAYDNLSSADFVVGEFPFHEFVQHISGKSSYDMISGIKEFYDRMNAVVMENGQAVLDVARIVRDTKKQIAWKMRDLDYSLPKIAAIMEVSTNTVGDWTKGYKKPGSEGDNQEQPPQKDTEKGTKKETKKKSKKSSKK